MIFGQDDVEACAGQEGFVETAQSRRKDGTQEQDCQQGEIKHAVGEERQMKGVCSWWFKVFFAVPGNARRKAQACAEQSQGRPDGRPENESQARSSGPVCQVAQTYWPREPPKHPG